MMNRREFSARAAALAACAACAALGDLASVARAADGEVKRQSLDDLLERVRKEHQLPGIAAAVVHANRIVSEGVGGVREVGTDDRITLDDRFLIGSCTKRMTATMICRVIDGGKLAFDTTLAEALPDVDMREDYRGVTIAQLLTFTAGLPPYMQVNPKQTPILFEREGSAAAQRERFVKHVLREEPVTKPGTERRYSNASYAVAAFVAARRTGRTWEALMAEEIFKPLELTRAGFGPPRTKQRPNEPRLHRKVARGYEPPPPGAPEPEGSPAMAGAGGVHCSIRDLATFAAYELAAARGDDRLLQPATARRWQELSRRDQQAEGRPVRGGTPWITAAYVLWPTKNTAAAVAINGGDAFEACEAVFEAVAER